MHCCEGLKCPLWQLPWVTRPPTALDEEVPLKSPRVSIMCPSCKVQWWREISLLLFCSISLAFDMRICFWRRAMVTIQNLWQYHVNKNDLSSALTWNQRELHCLDYSSFSDANKFHTGKSDWVLPWPLTLRSDFSAFYGKFGVKQPLCLTESRERGREGATGRKPHIQRTTASPSQLQRIESKESLVGKKYVITVCNAVPGPLCYFYMPFPLGLRDTLTITH